MIFQEPKDNFSSPRKSYFKKLLLKNVRLKLDFNNAAKQKEKSLKKSEYIFKKNLNTNKKTE